MLGKIPEKGFERYEVVGELETDLESEGLQKETSQAGEKFRSLLDTDTSVNSEITAETKGAIYSELTSQISRKLEEVKMDLNAPILEAIILAIEDKVLPTIQMP